MKTEQTAKMARATSPKERSGGDNDSAIPRGAFQLHEAARYLGVSVISVRRAIQRGLLHPNRVFRHLLFPRAELDRFLLDPGNTKRHTRLAPQCLPGSQNWRKAVAASQQNRELRTQKEE